MYPLCIAYTLNNKYFFEWIEEASPTKACFFILNNFIDNTCYYAHNLLFDFLLIFEPILSLKIKYSWVFINHNLYEVIIYYKNKKIILRCSHKLIPFPLHQFYPTLSNNKKLYFPYEILSNWNGNLACNTFPLIEAMFYNINLNEYIKMYALNDIQILNEGLFNFFLSLKNLNIPFTKKNMSCSSISFNFYFKNFNKINFDTNKNYKEILNQAYFGGKCEVYGNSKDCEKILHFDFSGMYFHCMQEELPYDDFYLKNENFNLNEPGFYYVNIEYYNKFPILPLKTDKLYFKEGKISGWYWYEEINLSLKYSRVTKLDILYGLISTKNDKILVEFLNTLHQFKDENSIKRRIGKLLINSFYGRLALSDDMYNIKLVDDLKHHKSYGELNNLFIIKQKISKKTKSNVALAAAIASKARIKLYEAQMEVLLNNGRLLYSDTDSIFASFHKDNQVENKHLGKHVFFDTLKKDTCIKEAVFISSKTYALKFYDNAELIKIKGINIRDVSLFDLKYKFYNNDPYINLNNNQFTKKNLSLEHFLISKTINLQNYNKRLWADDKKDTVPLKNT